MRANLPIFRKGGKSPVTPLKPPPVQKGVSATGRRLVMERGGSRPVSRVIGTRYFQVPESSSVQCRRFPSQAPAGRQLCAIIKSPAERVSNARNEQRRSAHCISASDVR